MMCKEGQKKNAFCRQYLQLLDLCVAGNCWLSTHVMSAVRRQCRLKSVLPIQKSLKLLKTLQYDITSTYTTALACYEALIAVPGGTSKIWPVSQTGLSHRRIDWESSLGMCIGVYIVEVHAKRRCDLVVAKKRLVRPRCPRCCLQEKKEAHGEATSRALRDSNTQPLDTLGQSKSSALPFYFVFENR